MYRIGQEEIDAVARVINRGELFKTTKEGETYHFEKEMREKFNVNRVISMTSGMAALESALVALGVGPGDEVIVSAYTYIANAIAVVKAGAIPVVAEVNESLSIDPADVEKKITPRTKVIVPTHMLGYPSDMDGVMAVAKKHNLKVLEDACQAVGGSYKGKRLGTIGDVGAFSFNFWKNISAGEGGALLTNDEMLFESALIYHDCCAVSYFGDQLTGFSTDLFVGREFRTNEITSAIMRVQLTRLDGILDDLRRNKKMLAQALSGHFKFIPQNDAEGECSNVLTLQFSSPEEAHGYFDKNGIISIPAMMGKHIYSAWDMLIDKRGAKHPRMNPFFFEENKNAPEYKAGSCPVSDRILNSVGHVTVKPDWTEADIEAKAKEIIDGLK